MLVHLTVHVDSGVLSSVPQACVVNNLTTELSLHAMDSILF